ncbi:MAG: alcohol dehydrogenase catalytic domain-containing protein [Vagococcus sp.]|nr:alcohol dehydrogenase catalytic domain-containing protein [Vagococcus sp.]
MLNSVYQLVAPRVIALKMTEVDVCDRVVVRPSMMALCAADQRYYQGQRPQDVLNKKLPMALIHEAVGTVVASDSDEILVGSQVAMIPNQLKSLDSASELYEHYSPHSFFLSSGHDGFMQELVALPAHRVVDCTGIDATYAVLSELLSVGVHAVERMQLVAHKRRETFGIWGDGPVGYLTGVVLRSFFPDAHITIIGRHQEKLAYFTYADATYLASNLPNSMRIDHAFECTGGEGCTAAINQIIKHAHPQACAILMGVSEANVAIRTRDILEKGLTMVGASRSGRNDFIGAVSLLKDPHVRQQISPIIHTDDPVKSVDDIKRVFMTDLYTPFKTIFEWYL